MQLVLIYKNKLYLFYLHNFDYNLLEILSNKEYINTNNKDLCIICNMYYII